MHLLNCTWGRQVFMGAAGVHSFFQISRVAVHPPLISGGLAPKDKESSQPVQHNLSQLFNSATIVLAGFKLNLHWCFYQHAGRCSVRVSLLFALICRDLSPTLSQPTRLAK
jgi:hypothetical protein